MDVAPDQIASIAAYRIPFLGTMTPTVLMGSNMQRRAVPLLRPQAPIVGTGIEARVARDSRVLINSEGEGSGYVDANTITIRYLATMKKSVW